MINKPMDVLQQFPIRRSKTQKQAFRSAVQEYIEKQGYTVKIEKGVLGANNVVIGNPDTAQYLVTAHYDTPASIGLPNLITPCNLFTYLLIQLYMLAIFSVASLPGGLLGYWLTDSWAIGYLVWYILYFVLFYLMLFGPANRNNANDNTSGVVTVLEILSSMPENMRHRVAFVLFDLEEMGLVGSKSYRKSHKDQTENQIVLNLDCVGDGENIVFFPVKKAKKNEQLLDQLRFVCGQFGERSISLHHKGFAAGNSDHKNFPNGVGIMAFHKAKLVGLYCDRIHTWRDTILDLTNINILRAAIVSLICQ